MKLAELFPEQFGSLPDDVEKNPNDWKSVSDSSDRNHSVFFEWLEGLTLVPSVLSGMTWMGQSRHPSP